MDAETTAQAIFEAVERRRHGGPVIEWDDLPEQQREWMTEAVAEVLGDFIGESNAVIEVYHQKYRPSFSDSGSRAIGWFWRLRDGNHQIPRPRRLPAFQPATKRGAVKITVACPVTWPATRACKAWGAPSSHGCR